MDIASILGFGAIGLGFLLAFLAYRLLATGEARERPIYIYMAFCLALLGVGAALHALVPRAGHDMSEIDASCFRPDHRGGDGGDGGRGPMIVIVAMAVTVSRGRGDDALRRRCRGSSLNTSDLMVTGTVSEGRRMRPRSI